MRGESYTICVAVLLCVTQRMEYDYEYDCIRVYMKSIDIASNQPSSLLIPSSPPDESAKMIQLQYLRLPSTASFVGLALGTVSTLLVQYLCRKSAESIYRLYYSFSHDASTCSTSTL